MVTVKEQQDVMKDKRVQEILQGLTKGETRDDLAEQFGHANYKTLDIYMRRKGFEWDSEHQNYRFATTPKKTALVPTANVEVATVDTSKAYRIVQLIEQQEDLDLEKIAQLMKFDDYKQLAAYMKNHNFVWSQEVGNYVKDAKIEKKVDSEELSVLSTQTGESFEGFAQYEPLLKMLKKNEFKLLELLQPYNVNGQIPRYTIKGGVAKTKTVQMVHSLDQMVVEFATEHNMTQRDLFEVALIDFFKKYGYEKQVEKLF
ncbi:hypothetical protein [Rummeliibacillus sp. POC4]|uniref:hypothetical protein n=1 Tax=Rummeliibacillus sp. POC4 TaxID=2305899 RepID=UPI000E6601B1|nr:hypothetical protein [Rummeliibacillus sp. POC4]RIJ69378.1 hypothetical protein D1606_01030 [Rummeliibacillus sp. POC4]